MGSETIAAEAFLEAMTLPVRQAAAAVRWLEGRVRNLPKPDEVTPEKAALTFGDCVAQEILLTALREHFPRVAIEAEEDTPTALAFADHRGPTRVVIDPIDGTLRYLKRDGPYAILLGLEHEGRIEAAIVALPKEDVLARAVRFRGAEVSWAGGRFEPVGAAQLGRGGARLLVSHELPRGLAPRLEGEGFELQKASGGAIGIAPLLPDTFGALRATRNPQGLSHRNWLSTLPTLEAGGCVESIHGPLPLCYEPGLDCLLVAGSRADAARLRKIFHAI